MRHTVSRFIALLGMVVGGTDEETQHLLLASGFSFNAGEKIRFRYDAGAAGNKARVNYAFGYWVVGADFPTYLVEYASRSSVRACTSTPTRGS